MRVFSPKSFIIGMIFGTVLLFSFILSLPDGRLHLVFCNVGQGDAVYIKAPNNQDMLIDGGPDDKVLTCLGKNMPFYDRTLEVVVLSHPQKDHLQGLISVIQRYTVKYFVVGVVGNQTEGYKKLVELIKKKNIPIKNLFTGDKFSLGDVHIKVLWPERQWLVSKVESGKDTWWRQKGSGAVLGLSTDTELNSFSYYLHLRYGEFDALFTGDGDSKIQPEVIRIGDLPNIEVLKFPHHGAKTAILPEFLEKIKPEIAIISVGKNPYGHPAKEAIELLSKKAIKIKRTDLDGEVQITSNGQNWSAK